MSLRPASESLDEAIAFLATSEVAFPSLEKLPAQAYVSGTTPPSTRWLFEDRVLQAGVSACVQAMNIPDVLEFRGQPVGSVAVIYGADELGRDAGAGVQVSAKEKGLEFFGV